MSFAAEPYGVFVDDLVSALTGGVTREDFAFLPERAPFRLGFGRDFVPGTVRVHGLSAGAFTRFHDGLDYEVDGDGVLSWKASGTGAAARATWPDQGSHFYVSYERVPDPEAPPRLTDRNPGSVLRTLAESFAREYAVLSRQLESVYRAAFLGTAAGRDLDHVAALVGTTRRRPTFASGEVVFSRRTPAPADVFIPEGTRVSTGEVPPVTVTTTEPRALRSGTLSTAVPVRAELEGPAGIARAGSLTVVNRPILGIDSASNPSVLTLGGTAETDESLRRRAARALETSGGATVGSLVGALTSVEGIRPQDVRVTEDHGGFPGLVKIAVAAKLRPEQATWAASLLEEHRPAGIRLAHNLADAVEAQRVGAPEGGPGAGTGPPPVGTARGTWYPLGATVTAVPSRPDLTTGDKTVLVDQIGKAVAALLADLGVGETLVYNRLVAVVMGIDGVHDAIVEVYPETEATAKGSGRAGRSNITPVPADTRPQLADGALDVSVWGALVALDVRTVIEPRGDSTDADPASVGYDARLDIRRRLADHLLQRPAPISQEGMLRVLSPISATATYAVVGLDFTSEAVDDGLRISRDNQDIMLRPDQAPWVRSVTVTVRKRTPV